MPDHSHSAIAGASKQNPAGLLHSASHRSEFEPAPRIRVTNAATTATAATNGRGTRSYLKRWFSPRSTKVVAPKTYTIETQMNARTSANDASRRRRQTTKGVTRVAIANVMTAPIDTCP